MQAPPDRVGWPERAALALLVACVAWAGVAGLVAGRMPPPTSPYVVAPAMLALGFAGGRLLTRRASAPLVAGALVVTMVAFLVAALLTDGPATLPLGYANANAAVAVQVAALGGLALVGSGRRGGAQPWVALAGAVLAVLAVLVVLANRSVGALVVLVPLVAVIGLAVRRPLRARSWPFRAGALAMLAAATAVLWLAARPQWPAAVTGALDPARQQLWHDAVDLWRLHPVIGAGPGSFQEFSSLADDADTSAAHSSLLQIGSETGVVGAVLLGLVALTGLWLAGRGRAAEAAIAVAGWTALGVHSLVDHLLEFPPVVITAGLVLGWASAGGSEELDVPEREGPLPR